MEQQRIGAPTLYYRYYEQLSSKCHLSQQRPSFYKVLHHIQHWKCYSYSIKIWGLRSPKSYSLIAFYSVVSPRPSASYFAQLTYSPYKAVQALTMEWPEGANGLQVHRLLWEKKDSLISLPRKKNMYRDFCLSVSAFGCFDIRVFIDSGRGCQSQSQQHLMTINHLPRS